MNIGEDNNTQSVGERLGECLSRQGERVVQLYAMHARLAAAVWHPPAEVLSPWLADEIAVFVQHTRRRLQRLYAEYAQWAQVWRHGRPGEIDAVEARPLWMEEHDARTERDSLKGKRIDRACLPSLLARHRSGEKKAEEELLNGYRWLAFEVALFKQHEKDRKRLFQAGQLLWELLQEALVLSVGRLRDNHETDVEKYLREAMLRAIEQLRPEPVRPLWVEERDARTERDSLKGKGIDRACLPSLLARHRSGEKKAEEELLNGYRWLAFEVALFKRHEQDRKRLFQAGGQLLWELLQGALVWAVGRLRGKNPTDVEPDLFIT